jgi:catechol 2,3-dioxygenase-like lactoylglutathione lyase family enzyme
MNQDFRLGTIGQISRKVGNIEAARDWYGKVLGLPHLYSFGKLAFFDCGGVRLFLSEEGDGKEDSILYFRVGDIQDACRTLAGRGVTFVDAPHMIHRHADGMEEWMAFFNDPDGKMLAVMAQIRPSTRS